MSDYPQNKDLINFLSGIRFTGGFFDTLKIKYRTYICPFTDLLKQVKEGDKVGDIGCGSGQFLLLVSEFSKQPASLYGIEIKPRLIENARTLFAQHQNIKSEFEVFDGIHLPERLGEMDIIFLIDVLHHVPVDRQKNFVADVCRLMKPGARLVFKDINAASPLVHFNKLHDLIFAGEIGNEWKARDASIFLSDCGMEIMEKTKKRMYVYPHYTIVARKK